MCVNPQACCNLAIANKNLGEFPVPVFAVDVVSSIIIADTSSGYFAAYIFTVNSGR